MKHMCFDWVPFSKWWWAVSVLSILLPHRSVNERVKQRPREYERERQRSPAHTHTVHPQTFFSFLLGESQDGKRRKICEQKYNEVVVDTGFNSEDRDRRWAEKERKTSSRPIASLCLYMNVRQWQRPVCLYVRLAIVTFKIKQMRINVYVKIA